MAVDPKVSSDKEVFPQIELWHWFAFGGLVAVLLALDLFVGLATLGRLASATTEELQALQAISRVRHAYLELVPTLEPYDLGPAHDDFASVLGAYGGAPATRVRPSILRAARHGLTTMPGLVMALTSAVAGAIAAVLAAVAGAEPPLALVVGVIAGALTMAGLFRHARWVDEMVVSRTKVSRRYPRTSRPFSTRVS